LGKHFFWLTNWCVNFEKQEYLLTYCQQIIFLVYMFAVKFDSIVYRCDVKYDKDRIPMVGFFRMVRELLCEKRLGPDKIPFLARILF